MITCSCYFVKGETKGEDKEHFVGKMRHVSNSQMLVVRCEKWICLNSPTKEQQIDKLDQIGLLSADIPLGTENEFCTGRKVIPFCFLHSS